MSDKQLMNISYQELQESSTDRLNILLNDIFALGPLQPEDDLYWLRKDIEQLILNKACNI